MINNGLMLLKLNRIMEKLIPLRIQTSSEYLRTVDFRMEDREREARSKWFGHVG